MRPIFVILIFASIFNPLYSGEDIWTSIGGPPGGYSKAVDFCPPPFTEIYASSDSFLYVSYDNGLSWQITDHPQKEFIDIKIGKIPFTDAYYVFTATTDGIYRGLNGTNWEQVYNLGCNQIVLDRNSCSYIYVISGSGSIIRSTDLGNSWVEIQPPSEWWCIEIDPYAPQTIYAGHHNIGLWKSTDAGADWQCLRFADTTIYDIDVSPRNSMVKAV